MLVPKITMPIQISQIGHHHEHKEAYDEVQAAPHNAELSHELIAGAASYEALKAYEDHCAANGKPDSYATAKEIMAGVGGAFIDRLVETKGLDYLDAQKAKKKAEEHYQEHYQNN